MAWSFPEALPLAETFLATRVMLFDPVEKKWRPDPDRSTDSLNEQLRCLVHERRAKIVYISGPTFSERRYQLGEGRVELIELTGVSILYLPSAEGVYDPIARDQSAETEPGRPGSPEVGSGSAVESLVQPAGPTDPQADSPLAIGPEVQVP